MVPIRLCTVHTPCTSNLFYIFNHLPVHTCHMVTQVALLALEVVRRALGVLRDTTKVVEAWQEAGPCLAPRPDVAPVPPDTPKILPVVHLAWQHAMAVLQV